MSKFNTVLSDLRKNRNLSQRALSDTLGLSHSTIGMYESGQREPNFETLKKIASFFNVSIDYLLGLTDDKNDFEHKNNLNEIVYTQLRSLNDIDDNHYFDRRLNDFSEHIKDGSFPVTEGSIDSIALLFDTNSLYLLGQTDNWYSEDPMDENFKKNVKEETRKLLNDQEKLVSEYNEKKIKEQQKILVNRAYNTLSDLGIHKLKGHSLYSIDAELLIEYYNIIIEYMKDTTKMVDFDKVIDRNKYISKNYIYSIHESNADYNSIKENVENYYFDFFTLMNLKSIDDVKSQHEFENYIADIYKRLGAEVKTSERQSSIESIYGDLIILYKKQRYIVECKYMPNANKLMNNLSNYKKNYSLIIKLKNNSDKSNSVYHYILATNVSSNKLTSQDKKNIWDYNHFKKLEIELKNKDKKDEKE